MLISIEYHRPVPNDAFSQQEPAYDLQKYFKRGWMEGRSLGVGRQENVFPRGFNRFFKDTKLPALVYPDGTGIVVLGKELGKILPDGRLAAYVAEVKKNPQGLALEELFPDENQGTFKVIGIPSMTTTLPFAWGGMVGSGDRLMCYGALMHVNGPSPERDIPLKTVRAMLDAMN